MHSVEKFVLILHCNPDILIIFLYSKKIMETMVNLSVGEMRKQAIIDTFFETLKNYRKVDPFATLEKIIEKAAKTKAPRFFVSFENARRFVSMLARKKKLPLVNKNKVELYKELFRRYKKCRQEDITNPVINYTLLEKIIEEPAPSFYLDSETFRCLLYKALRERNHELAYCKI